MKNINEKIEEEIFEPDNENDIFITDSGSLGSDYSISYAGKVLFETKEDYEKINKFLKAWMSKNKYWPIVWYVNDHGNIDIWTIE